MAHYQPLQWICRDRALTFSERPLIMGILNVTPDSFSDGGRHFDPDLAVAHGLRLVKEGADVVDVGGESTRPGAAGVPADEELRRVIPVIAGLARATDAVISVDTCKAAVARAAIAAGAHIINDVSAFAGDPDMPAAARESGAGAVLMHMQGVPRTMQNEPRYTDVAAEVSAYLRERVADLVARGLDRNRLAVDPGIGFGKTAEHNLQLLARLDLLAECGVPVAVGLSRKSFIGKLTGQTVENRLAGSLAALVFCVLRGAHILRVHDVRESLDAVRVAVALSQGGTALSS